MFGVAGSLNLSPQPPSPKRRGGLPEDCSSPPSPLRGEGPVGRGSLSRRAAFGRRSRTAIGWALGLFVVVQVASGLVLDYGTPLIRFPSARSVLGVARQDPTPPSFAFFGSSRTGAAIYHDDLNHILAEPGKPLPRTISMAVPAADAIAMEFLLDQLLESGPIPKWAVIEVSPETVNAENTWWMSVHVLRQLNWEHVPTHIQAAIKGKAAWPFLEARLVPTYTYRKQIVAETKETIVDWLPKKEAAGQGPAVTPDPSPVPLNWADLIRAPAKPPDDQLIENSRVGGQTIIRKSLTPYRVGGLSATALERMLVKCRSAGVRTILLGIPTCSAHRAEYTPAIEDEYDAFVRRLVTEYGCRYVDGRDWVPDTLFLDTLHVDIDGGKLFTRRLAGEVLNGLPSN
jgi:hypothetical protein